MRYFIIAGEQSGDLHGSNLIKGILKADGSAVIECWGGDLMEAAGARLMMHYRNTAFMGFVTVLKNLGSIRKNFALCKNHIETFKPDAVIFIDYPGFNLRMASYARRKGYRTFYYISPKLWAWNEKRVERIKSDVDRMFIIFPFEVGFYKKHGIEVDYFGNPLVDEIERRKAEMGPAASILEAVGNDGRPVIALLAGSRKHEIEHVLPAMTEVAGRFPAYQFILAGVKNLPDELYDKYIGGKPVKLVRDMTYEVLSVAEAALVTSGTATLETALLGTPQVVCFRGDFFSMLIAWIVIRVKYISLVNLIMEDEVVKELVQYELTASKLETELKKILKNGESRPVMLAAYDSLRQKLGPSGASVRIAAELVKDLESKIGK